MAGVEAIHGDLPTAMALFDAALEAFHRAGNVAHVAEALGELVVLFDHIRRPDVAAILYGASRRRRVARRRCVRVDYDTHVATGHSMSVSDAVRYAQEQLGHDPR